MGPFIKTSRQAAGKGMVSAQPIARREILGNPNTTSGGRSKNQKLFVQNSGTC